MFLCPHQPHHPCRPQFLPLQHLQPPLLLQLEQGGIDAELFGTAVLEDVIDSDAVRVSPQVMENTNRILLLVIHVHTKCVECLRNEMRTVKPSNYAYPTGAALGGTCGEEVVVQWGQDLEGVQLCIPVTWPFIFAVTFYTKIRASHSE